MFAADGAPIPSPAAAINFLHPTSPHSHQESREYHSILRA